MNSTGRNLILAAGNVSPCLLAKAGPELQYDCESLRPIKDGEVVVTGGHGLPCDNVIHACTPGWGSDDYLKVRTHLISSAAKTRDQSRSLGPSLILT